MEQYLQPTKAEAQKWATALRSGKYKQGKFTLETQDGNLCCLGVACLIFIPIEKRNLDRFGNLIGTVPEFQNDAPLWLRTINKDLYNKTEIHFSELNDTSPIIIFIDKSNHLLGRHTIEESFSFNEIADIIEMVYVLRILD